MLVECRPFQFYKCLARPGSQERRQGLARTSRFSSCVADPLHFCGFSSSSLFNTFRKTTGSCKALASLLTSGSCQTLVNSKGPTFDVFTRKVALLGLSRDFQGLSLVFQGFSGSQNTVIICIPGPQE